MNAVRHNQAQKWRDGPAAPLKLSRRRFFNWAVQGLGATAMTTLLGAQPHRVPRAKRGINICLVGGLSQIDSFDYKPDLARHHGAVTQQHELYGDLVVVPGDSFKETLSVSSFDDYDPHGE